jgi:hypothetical protein
MNAAQKRDSFAVPVPLTLRTGPGTVWVELGVRVHRGEQEASIRISHKGKLQEKREWSLSTPQPRAYQTVLPISP